MGHFVQRVEELDISVTTAGTPQRLSATSLNANSILIMAKDTNTGNVYIGHSQATAASGKGAVLEIGDSYVVRGSYDRNMLESFDLKEIWVDADISGDGVVVQYVRANING